MRSHVAKLSLAALCVTLAWGAHASDSQASQRPIEFIGVFHPAPPSFAFDRQRCPEPGHPVLLTFTGEAYTTLGRARFEQSHCEGFDHTSFTRGLQTITFDSGDQLFGKYSGLLLATPTTQNDGRLIIDGTYHNMGGTGGLRLAYGSGISMGTVDTTTGVALVTVSGTL